jgi:plastocyanin
VLALALTACGGGGDGGPASPSDPPVSGPSGRTINITASGVSPATLTVAAGTRVTFTNNDSRAHDMASNPHPEHTDCPELNQVGFLQAGQARESGNLNTVRTCRYHDHNQPNNTSLQGSIVIQ